MSKHLGSCAGSYKPDRTMAEISASMNYTAPVVTKEFLEEQVDRTDFEIMEDFSVCCTIHLKNGFRSSDINRCVHPENYSVEMAKSLSYQRAFDKLWELYGFAMREADYRAEQDACHSEIDTPPQQDDLVQSAALYKSALRGTMRVFDEGFSVRDLAASVAP